MDVISRKIEDLVKDGWDYGNWDGFWDWAVRVRAFLRRPLGEETEEFWGVISTDDVRADHELWTTHRQEAIGMLEGIVAQRTRVRAIVFLVDGRIDPSDREWSKNWNALKRCDVRLS